MFLQVLITSNGAITSLLIVIMAESAVRLDSSALIAPTCFELGTDGLGLVCNSMVYLLRGKAQPFNKMMQMIISQDKQQAILLNKVKLQNLNSRFYH